MKLGLIWLALVPGLVWAQAAGGGRGGEAPTTTAPTALDLPSSFFDAVVPREIGPTTMGGRIMDLAVYEADPRIFYVGTASAGVWRTDNGGTTIRPIFDRAGPLSIGSVAVHAKDPDIVWVGTGEGSSRNSVGWGDGVFRSDDGGKTWRHLGLKDTRSIPRIVLHPTNPDIAWVAALGSVWGTGPDRGVYRTEDGGKTWTQTLKIDDRTGVADLVVNPRNPNELLAAAWERYRSPYTFRSGGPAGGIFRSTDGGKSWTRITAGLPVGPLGRIGLSYSRSNPRVAMAVIERPPHDPDGDGIAEGEAAGGVFRSEDGGRTWRRTTILNPRAFYFSTILVDPADDQRVYLLGIQFHVSTDGGRTFRVAPINVHVDHHALWVDPRDPQHLILGNDGGVAVSRDRGQRWDVIDNFAIGQFYAIAFDYRKPFHVYGGLQDNGSWGGPTQGPAGAVTIFDWYRVNGGDGFHVQVDPSDWRWVYSESQGGALARLNQQTGQSAFIRPRPPQGETYRFNWSSPILISPHNPQTVYFGGNRLFKSVDRGANWRTVSPDLTTNDPAKLRAGEGSVSPEQTTAENHCTIVTVSESPLRQGVLWVGTDDGRLWVTQDDGQNWTDLTGKVPDVPANTWVSRVVASRHAVGRAYATFDGHRTNDFAPYVFMTDDFGQTWRKLSERLPESDVAYALAEGTRNPDFLILGTERSLYLSLDRGSSWTRLQSGDWPNVSVHDLAIHPRDLEAVIGTHGRSIWLLPVAALEQLTPANLARDVFLADPAPAYLAPFRTASVPPGDRYFAAANTWGTAQIYFHLKAAPEQAPTIIVADARGTTVATLRGEARAGLQRVVWNVRGGGGGRAAQGGRPVTAGAGDYRVTLRVGDREVVTSVRVEDASDAPENR